MSEQRTDVQELFAQLEAMTLIKRTGEFLRDDTTSELQPVYVVGDLDRKMGRPADLLQYMKEWWRPWRTVAQRQEVDPEAEPSEDDLRLLEEAQRMVEETEGEEEVQASRRAPS